MTDDQDGSVVLALHLLKDMDQAAETPQINAGFRLIKHRELRTARKDRSNLNTLDLAAGQARVQFTVNVILCTKPYLREI